jgi:hypothetical protein
MSRTYTLLEFAKGQYTSLPSTPVDLTGKTVFATRANTGLGREAARELPEMKPKKLNTISRNLAKGQEALRWVKEQTRGGDLGLWLASQAPKHSHVAAIARH